MARAAAVLVWLLALTTRAAADESQPIRFNAERLHGIHRPYGFSVESLLTLPVRGDLR